MFVVHCVFQSCLWQLPSLTWAAKATKTCVSKRRGGETPFAKPEMIKIPGLRPFPVSKDLPRPQFLLVVSTLKSIEWMFVHYSIGSRIFPATGEQRGRVSQLLAWQAPGKVIIWEVSGELSSMAYSLQAEARTLPASVLFRFSQVQCESIRLSERSR